MSQTVLSFAANKSTSKDVVQSLEELHQTLRTVASYKDGFDEKLSDYCFFPLSHVFRESQKLPVKALETSLLCLAILLETGWQQSIAANLSGQLLILLTFVASGGSTEKKDRRSSEELQTAAYHCLSLLFASLGQSRSGKESLVSTANVPQLGHTVTVILDGIVEGSSSDIQRSALSGLQSLLYCLSNHNILVNFFPGIVSSLTKVLNYSATSKRTYKLLEGALKSLANLFIFVIDDKKTRDLPVGITESGIDANKYGSLRTRSWLQATAGQIKQALANIVRLWQHDREEVKQALAELCVVVLRNCRSSLQDSANLMLETLVMLCDEQSDGSSGNNLKQILGVDPDLCELLRNSLRAWIISLPRIMDSNDDVAKQRLIHRVGLSYKLLSDQGADLTNVDLVMAANLQDSVALAIRQTSSTIENIGYELTPASLDVISRASREATTGFNSILVGRRGQRETMVEIEALLKQLSASSSAESLVQDLLQSYNSSFRDGRVANLWLAVQSVKGMSEQDSSIDQYLNFSITESGKRDALLEQLYAISLDILTDSHENEEYDWRLQALALEVLVMQAQEQREDFRVELIDALYPVVHLVGSPHEPLRRHAMTCLNLLAKFCGYRDASEIIVSNVDYLTNAVAFKLNGPEISPQAPMVLLMMIRLSGPSLIPYLDDMIGSMFVALENYHGYPKLVELLFAVLRVIAEESVKTPQLVITGNTDEANNSSQFRQTKVTNVIEDVKKLMEKLEGRNGDVAEEISGGFPKRPWKVPLEKPESPHNLIEEMSLDSEPEEDNEPPMDEPSDPGPPVPKTYNLLLEISQLTQHYLPASSSQFRLSLLSLLNTALPAIAAHENSFLPLINTLWPVLVSRLDDPEAHVIASTLDTICLLCKHAGQFMKGRIEDLWPSVMDLYDEKILKEVDKSAGEEPKMTDQSAQTSRNLVLRDLSLQRKSMVTYIDAPTRIIWKGLVDMLVVVTQYVPVSEEIFDDILHVFEPLLDEREDIRNVLHRRNPDAVWLAMVKRNSEAARRESGSHERGSVLGSQYPKRPLPRVPQQKWPFIEVAF